MRKLPLLRACAVGLQTQAQPLPGLEILMLHTVFRQKLAGGHKGKENPVLLTMCVTVVWGLDSLPFQFTYISVHKILGIIQ